VLAGRCRQAGGRGANVRTRCTRVGRAERERPDSAATGECASGRRPRRRVLKTGCAVRQVDQAELERFDGAAPGKYTSGLGQRRMAFCGDQEDVVSIALTAVKRLLEKYAIDPRDVGRRGRGCARCSPLTCGRRTWRACRPRTAQGPGSAGPGVDFRARHRRPLRLHDWPVHAFAVISALLLGGPRA
jgi:hypothetical protein